LTDDLVTNKAYGWDGQDDVFIDFGRSYIKESVMSFYGLTETQVADELEKRKTVLRWLAKTGKRKYKDVSKAILDYYADPDAILEIAKRELRRV
jgi:flagellar protein FlaI